MEKWRIDEDRWGDDERKKEGTRVRWGFSGLKMLEIKSWNLTWVGPIMPYPKPVWFVDPN